MLDSYIEEQPYFVEEIKKLVANKRISHAYLIETRNYKNADSIILSLGKFLYCSRHVKTMDCSSCNLCTLIDNGTNADFIQIRPDGSMIKKNQILNLKEKFKTTSFEEHSSRIYIIYEAEKLNKEAANALLKFLEEPESDVIAILVTDNRYRVINTIRSRCQIFSLINKDTEIEFSNLELTSNIIDCLEKKGRQAIAYLPTLIDHQYFTREQWIQILIEIQYIYEQCLRKFEDVHYCNELESILEIILAHNSESNLLHKLEVVHNQLLRLEYNLNINLMLDDFIIKFCSI